MKKRVRFVLSFLLLAILLISGGNILWHEWERAKGRQDYGEAAEIARGKQVPAEFLTEKKDDYADMLAEIDLEALREINSDVIGWIGIPDTEVFYPVMQAGDNDYYLNHTWKKERSSVGAVFLDYRNPADFNGFHSILYGHQMRDGSMFGGLHKYADKAYMEEHPIIYIVTDTGVQKYTIFAAYEADVRGIVYDMAAGEIDKRQEFIDYCLLHSADGAEAVPDADSHILTLSTCTGRGYATRWVVQAVQGSDNAE